MIILHLLRQHLLWTIRWSRVLEIEIRSEKRKLFWEKEIGSLLCFPIWKDIGAISMQFVQPGMEAATRMVNITDITWNKQHRKNMIGNLFLWPVLWDVSKTKWWYFMLWEGDKKNPIFWYCSDSKCHFSPKKDSFKGKKQAFTDTFLQFRNPTSPLFFKPKSWKI